MLKALGIILIFALVGGAAYWFLSPFIMPHINKLIPTATDFLSDAPSKLTSLIDYAKQNWQIIGTIAGGAFAGVTTISTWIYKRKMQAQEVINNKRVVDYQTAAIQADGARQRTEEDYKLLKTQYDTLAKEQPQVAELLETVQGKDKEIQTLITQRNQALALIPNKDTVKRIEAMLEKAEHKH